MNDINIFYLFPRLSENRHKDALHERAKKLKRHYREVGTVIIFFLSSILESKVKTVNYCMVGKWSST